MFKAINALLNIAGYIRGRIPCLKSCVDTATGGLIVTITSQVVVYAPSVSPLPLSLHAVGYP